jgi:hypothetical protein
MKESYGEDLVSHTDPESCAVACKGVREALTGARAGGQGDDRQTTTCLTNPPLNET